MEMDDKKELEESFDLFVDSFNEELDSLVDILSVSNKHLIFKVVALRNAFNHFTTTFNSRIQEIKQ
jgi:hypothetical protein